MMNKHSFSQKCHNLIERLNHLDFVDPFSAEYYKEMKAIEFEMSLLDKVEHAPNTAIKMPNFVEVHADISEQNLISVLNLLTERYSTNAKSAEDLETLIYSNINNYDFKAMKIKVKAQVDFLDLYFEIGKASTRHDIKKYLTEKTGVTHYISEHRNGFIIRLHDMNSMHQLQRRIQYLNHFDCEIDSILFMEMELAIDFYQFKHRALATALFKSIRLPSSTNNFRVFKSKSGVFTPIPNDPLTMISKLNASYNIGINHRSADEYWHLYVKTTDHNKQSLPQIDWRIRAEKNIKSNVLAQMDNRLLNVRQILNKGFTGLSFTQLKKTAPLDMKAKYKDSVKAFGQEQEIYYDKSRHKRTLPEHIEKNTALNQLISNAVQNLLRNFTISQK
ncbi:hypothetical protein F9230_01000 [Acinetobacter johnsonii]|uniref:hypothetical protein n=1 Tax=Acinetobacter johnsonii TaxID=40214 RepID=UPI001F3DCC31|nr:hypothetical protein [Acinetobacter johnsonii]UJA03052.1 hypothetical protein F9230_01000 [Acinetobacter johnsonii]